MIAGLPLATWVLMAVSVVPGVVLVVMAHRAHRGDLADSAGRAARAAGAEREREPRPEAGQDADSRHPPRSPDRA